MPRSVPVVHRPSPPVVTAIADHPDPAAALESARRVVAAAFGEQPSPAHAAAKDPMVDPARWFLATIDGEPCGSVGSFATELTLPGGAAVPAMAVSDVGVSPTHRRQGVAAALMAQQLDVAADAGDAVAVLHASEAAIYGRFGYGVAVRWRQVRVASARVRFRPDRPMAGGRTRVVSRWDAALVCPEVHDAVRATTPGGLARSPEWWDVVFGDSRAYLGGDPSHLVIVHEDDAGTPDGYAIYRVHEDWSGGQARHTLAVWELIGTSPAVELDLWATLVDHDLVEAVTGPVRVDHELFDVVADGRQISTMWDQDLLWLRVLDVEAVLGARSAGSGDRVVVQVDDPGRPAAGGRFLLAGADGKLTCTRADLPPDATLDVAELSSMALGGGSARGLARAGRIAVHQSDAAARLDRLLQGDPKPWCWVRF